MISKTRQITDGAMMIALIGLFLLINRQTANSLESIIYWVLSFPMVLYSAKYGLKASSVPFVACLLLSLMIAAPTTIFYLFAALSVGIVYGTGVRQRWNNGLLLCVTIGMEMISLLVTVVVLSGVFGFDLEMELSAISEAISFVGNYMNVNNFAMMMLVIVYVGSSILQAIVIHLVSHQLLGKLSIEVRPLKTIFDVKMPRWVSFVIVGVWIIYGLQVFLQYDEVVSTYLLVAYTIVFLIGVSDGVLTILCLLMKAKKMKFIALAILACFIPLINNLIFWIGTYDIYSGYREQLKRG